MQSDEFEWDDAKAVANLKKHRVSFEAARLVFDDLSALDRGEEGGNAEEARYLSTGMVNGVLLTVAYTHREDRIRIISARKATRHEQREYDRSKAPE
jgi:uncharacterized DUF497 family protein